jgi:hypothetical protein
MVTAFVGSSAQPKLLPFVEVLPCHALPCPGRCPARSLLVVELDRGPAKLREQDLIALLHAGRDQLAVPSAAAGAHRQNDALVDLRQARRRGQSRGEAGQKTGAPTAHPALALGDAC